MPANGIFDDEESIFPDDTYQGNPPEGPVFTRAEEDEDMVGHMGDERPAKPQYQELLAQWDERGNVLVAWSLNGKLQERYRPPTKEEWNLLQARGEWVRGGLQGAGDIVDVAPSGGLLSRVPKLVWVAGGVLAAAGLSYVAYRKYKDGALADLLTPDEGAGDDDSTDEEDSDDVNDVEDDLDELSEAS